MKGKERQKVMEIPRIELGASYMQSMRSTTELYPLMYSLEVESDKHTFD